MPAKNAKGTDRYDKTMAELTEEAHDVGIPFVAHMSFSELIEAIEQQRETNAAYAPEPRRPEESVDTARSARKERGESSPKRVTPGGVTR